MSPKAHPRDTLVRHALDPASALPPEVRAHLDGCPDCAGELEAMRAATGRLLQIHPVAVAPDRVLRAVREAMTGPRRLDRFLSTVANLLDIDEAAARTLLGQADGEDGWLTAGGVAVRPAPTGPRASDALATLCRIQAGAGLDDHLHDGPEDMLVLEGGFRDTDGHELWPGEQLTMPPGSHHALVALPGVPCLCVVLARIA